MPAEVINIISYIYKFTIVKRRFCPCTPMYRIPGWISIWL